MLIGITEAGDASLNYDWTEKMDDVDGAIIITKNITEKFMKEILKVKDKTILHCSCTGYGGTVVEPKIPNYQIQIENLKRLIENGFPVEHVVLRIDPIIPTEKGLSVVENVLEYTLELIPELKRVRISILDMYPHVLERFKKKNMDNELPYKKFSADVKLMQTVDGFLKNLREKYGVEFEACAEPNLKNVNQLGCVSTVDLNILRLQFTDADTKLKGQRKTCLCIAPKKELLKYAWNKTGYNYCYGCMYCYWKTDMD